MSQINFCSNPVANEMASGMRKVVKETSGEMKPFPELCKGAMDQCHKAPEKYQYTSPSELYAITAKQTAAEQANQLLSAKAAAKEYEKRPPEPFN